MRFPVFDWLRLFLAVEVMIHPDWLRRWPLAAVPCFVGISGWMILRSWKSSASPSEFWLKRATRILPAFFLCMILTTVLHGPAKTVDSLHTYVTLGFHPGFNLSLWSLGVEEIFYLLLALGCMASVVNKWSSLAAAAVTSIALIPLLALLPKGTAQYAFLVPSFLIGVAVSYWPLRWSVYWTLLVTAATYFLAVRFGGFWGPLNVYVSVMLVIQLGQVPLPKRWALPADLSYGIYIYHYPILMWFFWTGMPTIPAWVLGSLAIFVFSYLSYKFVEKPALALRKRFKSSATQRPSELAPTLTDLTLIADSS